LCKLQYSKASQVFTLYVPAEFVKEKGWKKGDHIVVIEQKDNITLKKAGDLSSIKGTYMLMKLQYTKQSQVYTITIPAQFVNSKGWKPGDNIKATNYDDTISLKKIEV